MNELAQNLRLSRRRHTLRRFRPTPLRPMGFESLEDRCVLSAYQPTLDLPGDQAVVEGQGLDLTAVFSDMDPADTYNATIDWGDGTIQNGAVTTSSAFNTALRVRIDYSRDAALFFDTPEKRDLMQLAADTVVARLADTLSAINPGPAGGGVTNTWTAIFTNPSTGANTAVSDLTIQSNEILLFVGGRDLTSPSLASGGFGGYEDLSGTSSFVQAVQARGESGALNMGNETDIGPWGGFIAFSTRDSVNWHFGKTTAGLGPGETDFLTVAMHEIGHVLGFGTAKSFQNLAKTSPSEFTGPASVAEYDDAGNPPLNSDQSHWAEGTMDEGQETAMDPTIGPNVRKLFTPLDYAALDDIGWTVVPERQGNIKGSHTYADNGVYTVMVKITDNTGRQTTESFDVTVNNIRPVLTVTSTKTTHENQLLSINNIATFTDPGFNNPLDSPPTFETFTYRINWGDGSAIQTGTVPVDTAGSAGTPTSGSLDASHTFISQGTYSVVVAIEDDDGGLDVGSFSVVVFEGVDAVNDSTLSTQEDTVLDLSAPGVLANDSGDLLRVTAVSGSTNLVGTSFTLTSGATVTLQQNGRLLYDPTTSGSLAALEDGQSAVDQFTYTISDGRGAFDTATISITVMGVTDSGVTVQWDTRLVLSPTPTQTNDQLATLPASAVWIDEWRPFWLELYLRVDGIADVGIASATASQFYNSDYFSVVSVEPGSAFANGFSAVPNDTLGRVDISASTNLGQPVGAESYVLLARIEFAATQDDVGVPIGLDQPGYVQPVSDEWIPLISSPSISLTGGASIGPVLVSRPPTELWPMLYDLDDDGLIGFGDFSILSSTFLDNASESPAAAKSDFDQSGTVGFGDLSYLSANFLRGRANASMIVFPDNYAGGASSAASTAAASAPSAAAMALAEIPPVEIAAAEQNVVSSAAHADDDVGSPGIALSSAAATEPAAWQFVLPEAISSVTKDSDSRRQTAVSDELPRSASEMADSDDLLEGRTLDGRAVDDVLDNSYDVDWIQLTAGDELEPHDAFLCADAGSTLDVALLDKLLADFGDNWA